MTALPSRPKGSQYEPTQKKTSPMKEGAPTKPAGWTMISREASAAFLSVGSSAIAIGTHNAVVAITLAALTSISIVTTCLVAVIHSWNRDVAIIDARTRSKIMRHWARRAETQEEMEDAARAAFLPLICPWENSCRNTK